MQLLGLAIEISSVQFPAILLSHSDFMQAIHMHAPLFTKQYKLVPSVGLAESNGSLLTPAGCLHPKTDMSTVPCGPYDYGCMCTCTFTFTFACTLGERRLQYCIQTYHYPTGSMPCFLLKIEFKQCL